MRLPFTPARVIATLCLLFWSGAIPARADMMDVPGGRLSVETCGTGPRTIVLLHDGILHSAAYDAVWPQLCERFRVIRYDRRGYGASAPATGPYAPVRDLEAVLKAQGVTHATFVGASSGGGLAVDFALTHPESVDRLVLAGPWVAGFRPTLGFTIRNLTLLALFRAGLLDQAVRDPYILTRDADEARARVSAWLRASPGNITAGSAERFTLLARPRLGEIRAPTLVLVGASDMRAVRVQAAEVAKGVQNGRLMVVPSAGHFMYVEQPADFAARIIAFMGPDPVGG
ncbi:MAG: alpha/beta hydrolase [Caulobacter sp.]|nr:alpha/beta hydrolase [Caulobacter sp.]